MRSNLINFRKTLGLTQGEFGKLFEHTKAQICNIEKNKLDGSPDLWLDIGNKFNLTVEQLKKLREVF